MHVHVCVPPCASLQELRKTNKLDVDDLTVESGLFKSFDEIVRRQLDPVWHSLGRKVKQVDGVRQGKMGCSIGRWGAALLDGVQHWYMGCGRGRWGVAGVDGVQHW